MTTVVNEPSPITYNFWQIAVTICGKVRGWGGEGRRCPFRLQYTHLGSKVTRKAVSLRTHLLSLNLSASSGQFTWEIWEQTALWPLSNSSSPLAYLRLTQRYSAYRILLLFVGMCVLYVCVHVCACAWMWRPELDLGVFVLNELSFSPSFLSLSQLSVLASFLLTWHKLEPSGRRELNWDKASVRLDYRQACRAHS